MHPQLLRKLSKPSKVASILDWNKAFDNTVLSLNFHKNRVGIAVASHPSLGIPCIELEPLRFDSINGNRKNIAGSIDRHCLERFSDIIEGYKVCGVVVNWPLQSDTGRMGAACGRVIFALEQLVERSNESVIDGPCGSANANGNGSGNGSVYGTTKKNHDRGGFLSRPFCLWDAGHIDLKQRADPSKRVDVFGRCASYGRETTTTTQMDSVCTKITPAANTSTAVRDPQGHKKYFAGKAQYHEDELTVVLGVWDDFCREHWPDLYESSHLHNSYNNNNNNNNTSGNTITANGEELLCNEFGNSGTAATTTTTPDQIPIQMASPKLRNIAGMKQKKSLIIMR